MKYLDESLISEERGKNTKYKTKHKQTNMLKSLSPECGNINLCKARRKFEEGYIVYTSRHRSIPV